MLVEHFHPLHQRELRLVLGKNNLCRGFATFLQRMNKLVQMFHVDGDDIQTEQSVTGNYRDSEYFRLHKKFLVQRGGGLAWRLDLDDGAHGKTEWPVI